MRSALTAVAIVLAGGCVTKNIEAPVVQPWEGRYSLKEDAVEAAKRIKLSKGESVWILSSTTMKRLLKETKE